MRHYIGIDTSCYTTSVAVADEQQNILCNEKILLEVASGAKGLRQSQAVFLHIQNIGKLFAQKRMADFAPFGGVCASSKPREQEGSYMPVFQVSEGVGGVMASTLGVPLYRSTHQHGHIYAALIGNQMPERFLACHVSGGTTELLRVELQKDDITLLGATDDIAAGQLVDRVAQRMKLPFPGGPALERMAQTGEDAQYKISCKALRMNFSGLEAQAMRSLDAGAKPEDVAKSVLCGIARTLTQLLCEAEAKDALLFGGVMCNGLIRDWIGQRIANVRFAQQSYASDNAAGLAVLASKLAQRSNNEV